MSSAGAAHVRTGIGWDSHRLTEGRALILGGVAFEHSHGLLGHSDADVLTHAVIDALLGAAGLDDIGALFPDTDPAFKDADSIALLQDVVDRVTGAGYTINNMDTTVVMERPKLSPKRAAIRARLAAALDIDQDRVNVKASTGEGLGFVGRGEGVAALAVATLSADGGSS
jgi:2-C-methyl-D-erythritol 2,4-cyclodiphosphate synthase